MEDDINQYPKYTIYYIYTTLDFWLYGVIA